MPTISMFYGILMRMCFYDDKKHSVPHIHAEYGGHHVTCSIEDGSILAGSPAPALRLRRESRWSAG